MWWPFQKSSAQPSEHARPAAAPARRLPDEAVIAAARTQARQRLIGAVVLLLVGIIGFPILFETQPRPMSPDLPFELAKPAAAPEVSAPAPAARSDAPAAGRAAPLNLPPADAGIESAAGVASAPAPTTEPSLPVKPVASAPIAAVPASAAPLPRPTPAPPPVRAAEDGNRARALLEGATSAPGQAERFIVQAGAFTDATKLRETRQKVESLGLKTYTQVIDSEAGKRTRVRVGPFATRQEAEAAAARIKAAGLQATVLGL